MNKTADSLYHDAITIAENITNEMKFVYVCYEILEASEPDKVGEKFTNTFAGHTWVTLRRTLLNDIHLGLAKIIDKNKKASSLPNLHKLLKNKEVQMLVRSNYMNYDDLFEDDDPIFEDHDSAFDDRLQRLMEALEGLRNDSSKFKSLTDHRNNYLAHRSISPYQGNENLKWGDEAKLIQEIEGIVNKMEIVLLNAWDVSGYVRGSYRIYAKDFWDSFAPNK